MTERELFVAPKRRRSRLIAVVAGAAMASSAFVAADLAVTSGSASAAYAEGGSGSYIGAIDWIEWGEHDEPVVNGTTATSTRDIAGHELTTTCVISDVRGDVSAYRSGDYTGDSLDDLYNIGGVGNDNQLIYGLANLVNGADVGFGFSCETTLNGEPVPLGGLVVADAESSNLSAFQDEHIFATPDDEALADDETAQPDEDAIEPLGDVDVAPGEAYALPGVACTGPGYVSGWIDWDRDGAFADGERSTAECVDGSVDLSWAGPPARGRPTTSCAKSERTLTMDS